MKLFFSELFKNAHFYIFCIILLFYTIFVSGCASTSKKEKLAHDAETVRKVAQTKVVNFNNQENAYVFIRLYKPVYKNPLTLTNLLRFCLKVTATNDSISATSSHASIGLSLDDSFVSLTFRDNSNVKVENCEDVSTNVFMNSCNPHSSTQETYALKVTPEEYEHIRSMILESENYRYYTLQNFKIAPYSIKRHFFTAKENQRIDRFYVMQNPHSEESMEKNPCDVVCSSFVAHILDESVGEIHKFLVKNNIDWRYLTVSDLVELPGMEFLFASPWDEYSETATSFALSHSEFSPYAPVLSSAGQTKTSQDF